MTGPQSAHEEAERTAANVAIIHRVHQWPAFLQPLPGVALTFVIALLAMALRQIPHMAVFSSLILAILIGIAFHNLVRTPVVALPGVKFSMRRILRLSIILYGLQLTAAQVASVGIQGFLAVSFILLATFLFTVRVGRMMGVDRKLAELVAAGTSVCGAAAVVATNTVTDGSEEDVAYGVACVTVFGTIAMFLYPLLPDLLHLNARAFGLWSGSSIHEVAQVVAASMQNGQVSGEFGLIAKLSRVALLAPLVLSLGFLRARGTNAEGGARASAPLPWFVFGFLAMVAVNSLFTIPAEWKQRLIAVTPFLLSMATAAMGLETDIRKLKAKGLRPLLLGGVASVFIALLALLMVHTVMAT